MGHYVWHRPKPMQNLKDVQFYLGLPQSSIPTIYAGQASSFIFSYKLAKCTGLTYTELATVDQENATMWRSVMFLWAVIISGRVCREKLPKFILLVTRAWSFMVPTLSSNLSGLIRSLCERTRGVSHRRQAGHLPRQ